MIEVRIPESCITGLCDMLSGKLQDRETAIKKLEKDKADLGFRISELEAQVKQLKADNRMMHEQLDEKF